MRNLLHPYMVTCHSATMNSTRLHRVRYFTAISKQPILLSNIRPDLSGNNFRFIESYCSWNQTAGMHGVKRLQSDHLTIPRIEKSLSNVIGICRGSKMDQVPKRKNQSIFIQSNLLARCITLPRHPPINLVWSGVTLSRSLQSSSLSSSPLGGRDYLLLRRYSQQPNNGINSSSDTQPKELPTERVGIDSQSTSHVPASCIESSWIPKPFRPYLHLARADKQVQGLGITLWTFGTWQDSRIILIHFFV